MGYLSGWDAAFAALLTLVTRKRPIQLQPDPAKWTDAEPRKTSSVSMVYRPNVVKSIIGYRLRSERLSICNSAIPATPPTVYWRVDDRADRPEQTVH